MADTTSKNPGAKLISQETYNEWHKKVCAINEEYGFNTALVLTGRTTDRGIETQVAIQGNTLSVMHLFVKAGKSFTKTWGKAVTNLSPELQGKVEVLAYAHASLSEALKNEKKLQASDN